MGKCKKRTLRKSSSYFMTREEAVNNVFKTISKTIKKDGDYKKVLDTISLFGITAEELSEAGVPYENLAALDNILT